MADALLFVLVLLLAVGAPLVLYVLIESETEDLPTMDREAAERAARRDTPDESARNDRN